MKKLIVFSVLALLIFTTVGCEKNKEEKEILSDAKIVKTLSLKYLGESYGRVGEIMIVNSQEKLNKIYKNATMPKDLENIDFGKRTVVMGSYGAARGVSKLEHKFSKVGDKYEYLLTITLNYTTVAPLFSFGIIAEKIPSNSEVVLKVNVKE